MQTISFSKLYHVGTLRLSDKAQVFSQSQEGHGLSVSEHPQAWIAIARLGGLPTWQLTRVGNQFLDYHALTEGNRQSILEWAISTGLVSMQVRWRASYFDDELGEDLQVIEQSKASALAELGCEDESELDEGQTIDEVLIPVATESLAAYLHFRPAEMWVPDMIAVAYADQVLQLDGVFWNDTLAPANLSAPRAVILPEKLALWHITPTAAK